MTPVTAPEKTTKNEPDPSCGVKRTPPPDAKDNNEEKLEIRLMRNGTMLGWIDMGDPGENSIFKEEVVWYKQQAIAPYVVSVRISRLRKFK